MDKKDIMYLNAAINECVELDSCLFHLGKKGLKNAMQLRVALSNITNNLRYEKKELLNE